MATITYPSIVHARFIVSNSMAVAASTSISAAIALDGGTPVAIVTPATLAATSAQIVWQASADNLTYTTMYGGAGEIRMDGVSTTASRWVFLDPSNFLGMSYIRFRIMKVSGLTAVSQGAAKTFTLYTRKFA